VQAKLFGRAPELSFPDPADFRQTRVGSFTVKPAPFAARGADKREWRKSG
jgi:hypothetical protein